MVTRQDWRAAASDIEAVIGARHGDPFALLGPHQVKEGVVVRSFVPHAETLEVLSPQGKVLARLERRHDAGFFEGLVPGLAWPARYRLRAANASASWELHDPYAFGTVLGPLDDYLLLEGTHRRLYDRLGAHPGVQDDVKGVRFAVWAPHARRVSVVGDFNAWDGRRHQMRKRIDSGIWEIFAPDIGEGTTYKYEIVSQDGRLLPLKADPVGFAAELRPSTASVVAETHFPPSPSPALPGPARQAPISIHEVHLGSWKRHPSGRFLTYDELADELIPYTVEMGYTHLQLLPVTEHPLDDSWGYQPIGLFAPTRRFGEPAGFARFVDKAHQAGLGVILDWVPAHFPVDVHGLAQFDGTALYEHPDPRRGFHPDWNTAIYDFGKAEVSAFLVSSALYWFERFHVDGLRVDAVASMLHLNYSRPDGQWLPNPDGSSENRDAERFLQAVNQAVHEAFPQALMIAEESTTWPGVTRPVREGGLGFDFKWNMGWMNDTLRYLSLNPVHRQWHHDLMTFGLTYAWSEAFVLPYSHDEVVHGKASMLAKMGGDEWQRFAGLRATYGWMWGQPGKKLLFMGQEFGQWREWNFRQGLDWFLREDGRHEGIRHLVKDLNALYRAMPALHRGDDRPEGFSWIVVDDKAQSVFAWLRHDPAGEAPPVACLCNFTPVPREGYRIGLPHAGEWREVLNTDAALYGGSGLGNLGAVMAEPVPSHGYPASAVVTVPPMAALFLSPAPGEERSKS
ncbi:1,4-alpha-glucan branching protein GlgB [Acetobacteraceae bacterium H6797]|nr:1,4-alpha-glucan branching protein GlgB [Acetobacteraceae bacterium H6797]